MQDTLLRRTAVAEVPDSVTPAKLAHIVLKTSNFEAMTNWYLTVLNARIALSNPFLAFMTYDDEHHRLGIANVPRLGHTDPNRAGIDHVSFTYANLGDLLKTYVRLREQGIEPAWSINHGVTTSFYYKDPDGNKVELQIDNFETAVELQDYFENDPDFAVNPLGAPFDPNKMIADYEAGVPTRELLKVPPYEEGMSPQKILHDMGFGSDPV